MPLMTPFLLQGPHQNSLSTQDKNSGRGMSSIGWTLFPELHTTCTVFPMGTSSELASSDNDIVCSKCHSPGGISHITKHSNGKCNSTSSTATPTANPLYLFGNRDKINFLSTNGRGLQHPQHPNNGNIQRKRIPLHVPMAPSQTHQSPA